ncbi:hypothetical protein KC359_g89 [Hortaea werneckii]|nr:hypothetical protein KC359_g89 [Hortaea werneckii]
MLGSAPLRAGRAIFGSHSGRASRICDRAWSEVMPPDKQNALLVTKGCEIQARCWIGYSPMDKYSATSIERILNEVIAGWEVLEQVFIVNVVYLDDLVCKESGQRIRSLELATGLENGKAICAYEPANPSSMIPSVGVQCFGCSMIANWPVDDAINLKVGLWQWIGSVQSFAKPVGYPPEWSRISPIWLEEDGRKAQQGCSHATSQALTAEGRLEMQR